MDDFIPHKGYYKNLRVYKVTEIIYDITYIFTKRFLRTGDRTIDQMLQAARSGKQNIAEGSVAGTTSKETAAAMARSNITSITVKSFILFLYQFV